MDHAPSLAQCPSRVKSGHHVDSRRPVLPRLPGGRAGNLKPDKKVAIAGGVVVADRRAQVPGKVIPGAAAKRSSATITRDHRDRRIARCPVVVVPPAILDPLHGVSEHVVQSERIRREGADRRRERIAIFAVRASLVGKSLLEALVRAVGAAALIDTRLAPPPRRRRATTRAILPPGLV